MSQIKLTAAREFIQEKNYRVARAILESLPYDPIAAKWLRKLNSIDPSGSTLEQPQQYSNYAYPPMSYSPPTPIQYEYKTVKIVYTFNHDRAMNNKIQELSEEGWEFVGYTDEGRTNIFGMRITDARILSFRRPVM